MIERLKDVLAWVAVIAAHASYVIAVPWALAFFLLPGVKIGL